METNVNAEGTLSEEDNYIKMDWSLTTPEERRDKVQEIIDNTPPERLTPYYLGKMADYILYAVDQQEKKKGQKNNILTDNRMVTVNKREISFEGLTEKLEGGESAVHNIIANDKNIIFAPKKTITKRDLDAIPYLREMRKGISQLVELLKTKTGREAYILGQQIKALRQDQYIIKECFWRPIRFTHAMNHGSTFGINLSEEISVDKEGNITHKGLINLFNPKHVSALLQYYPKLKEDTYSNFTDDFHWLVEDLEVYIDRALEEKYPMYYDLLIYKIDGLKNVNIQEKLFEKYGIKHSIEYISSLWRNKIPKLIAEEAERDWLIWHYTMEEKGNWKKCTCCGEVKLAHNKFFSKNSTSKDGFYSICKECRNKKYQENKGKKR